MDWWHELERWWFAKVGDGKLWGIRHSTISTWIGHGLITKLFVWIGALVGLLVGHVVLGAAFGFVFGLGVYFGKEGNEIIEGGWGNKIDHLGDVCGPIILGGLTLVILAAVV